MPASTRFRLNFPALVRGLVPSLLRKPRTLAWLEVLTSPIETIYQDFLNYQADVLRQLSYNGQTIMMEKALNDTFDPGFRRIRVRNAVGELAPVYVNFVREQQPNPTTTFVQEAGHQPLYLRHQVEFNSQVDFTVYAPGLAAQALGLHAMVRRLKRAMTNYQILYTTAPN
ncbi:hypothetical protein [Hymenobacter glacieicola]|uniref:Coenzyme Q-binding protein COQ10 START domain-containing protein n=1 Tax=Hymenobacter glacieicola TaxID=1562124 RepID=A0ABQ1WJ46_9BACT|nr:hypothetical protein [Hymenobacter glacieicola]GGG33513.1 hypothetical protein GCM10011378_07480 [Hymenobacter glacieicola]